MQTNSTLKEQLRRNTVALISVVIAITKGAHIVRVHDVAVMKNVAVMTDAVIYPGKN